MRVRVCHCLACQRRTGSAFGVQARFAREHVEVTGIWHEYVRHSDEDGEARTFRFCPECGATVFYGIPAEPELVIVPVGAFADPSFPAPGSEIYEDRAHPWVTVEA